MCIRDSYQRVPAGMWRFASAAACFRQLAAACGSAGRFAALGGGHGFCRAAVCIGLAAVCDGFAAVRAAVCDGFSAVCGAL
eukprot:13379546-Alexandrium_andersonii.AAC.1